MPTVAELREKGTTKLLDDTYKRALYQARKNWAKREYLPAVQAVFNKEYLMHSFSGVSTLILSGWEIEKMELLGRYSEGRPYNPRHYIKHILEVAPVYGSSIRLNFGLNIQEDNPETPVKFWCGLTTQIYEIDYRALTYVSLPGPEGSITKFVRETLHKIVDHMQTLDPKKLREEEDATGRDHPQHLKHLFEEN